MENNDTQKAIYDSEQLVEWGGLLNEFLWICAGADRKVLRQCPTDYAKYAGIGGTILFTALMAMLSGGYALYTVFDDFWIALGFGIFWGLLIFNLDRFIVNTMYSDGKTTISWMEFFSGLPRIIMAIFLGIVISTPLELKIFEDAIDIKIEQEKDKMLEQKISNTIAQRDSIDTRRNNVLNNGINIFDEGLDIANQENEQFNNLAKEQSKIIQEKESQLNKLHSKRGELANRRSALYARCSKQDSILARNLSSTIRDLDGQIVNLQREIRSANQTKNTYDIQAASSLNNASELSRSKAEAIEKESERLRLNSDSLTRIASEAKIKHADWSEAQIKSNGSFRDLLDLEYKGFQAKMKAFSELKEESNSTWWSSLFVMLLFIIIETAPTFFKMMMEDGPYDDLLRAERYRVKVLADKRISDVNDDVNTSVRISVDKNKGRLEAELNANKVVMTKLAQVQAELLEEAIECWRKDELEKVRNNPSQYIQSTNSNNTI